MVLTLNNYSQRKTSTKADRLPAVHSLSTYSRGRDRLLLLTLSQRPVSSENVVLSCTQLLVMLTLTQLPVAFTHLSLVPTLTQVSVVLTFTQLLPAAPRPTSGQWRSPASSPSTPGWESSCLPSPACLWGCYGWLFRTCSPASSTCR